MAVRSGKQNTGMILLVTIIGLILGSFLSVVIDSILQAFNAGSDNVIGIFTWSYPLGMGYPTPMIVDLGAVKFQLGFQLDINAMSFFGVWLAHKFYKTHQ